MISITHFTALKPKFKVEPLASAYSEGDVASFKVTTENVNSPGLSLQWIVDNEEDLEQTYMGEFVLDENSEAMIELDILEDYLTEGQETLRISIMEEQGPQDGVAHTTIYEPYQLDGMEVLSDSSIIIIDTSTAYVLAGYTTVGDIKCYGTNSGWVYINMTEGVEPYTYQWRKDGEVIPFASGSNLDFLYPGTYTVDVTDSRNIFKRFTAIVNESVTMLEVSSTTTTSMVTITASGGTAPYTYIMMTDPQVQHGPVNGSAAFPNLASNTGYTFSVIDANNCETWHLAATQSEGPPVISQSVIIQQPYCFGWTGAIGITVNGGQGALSYSWSNGSSEVDTISNLAPGNYSVTVTDEIGQSDSAGPWEIINPDKITNLANIQDTAIQISSNAYSIEWADTTSSSFNRTGLARNTQYTYTLYSATCSRGPLTVTTSCAAITGSYSLVNAVSCYGGTDGKIRFNTSYDAINNTTWTVPAGLTQSAATSTYREFTGPAGTYTITVAGASGYECIGSISGTVQIVEPIAMSTGATVTATTISLSASGGSGNYTYSWQDSGVVTAYRSGLSSSTVYYWTISDGCSTVSGQSTTSNAEIIYYEKLLTVSGKFAVGDFCPEPSYGAYSMQNSVWVDDTNLVGLLGKIIRNPQTLGAKGSDTTIPYTPMDGNSLVWLIAEIPAGDTSESPYVLFDELGGQKWIRINSNGEVIAEGTTDPCSSSGGGGPTTDNAFTIERTSDGFSTYAQLNSSFAVNQIVNISNDFQCYEIMGTAVVSDPSIFPTITGLCGGGPKGGDGITPE